MNAKFHQTLNNHIYLLVACRYMVCTILQIYNLYKNIKECFYNLYLQYLQEQSKIKHWRLNEEIENNLWFSVINSVIFKTVNLCQFVSKSRHYILRSFQNNQTFSFLYTFSNSHITRKCIHSVVSVFIRQGYLV